jgi:NADH-quinone oxidoreductase subunit L
VVASVAIAGVPGLAGFFSKDEILYETFKEGHWILWTIGALTSLLTATYMFRLVFLTFFGKRRHDAPAAAHPEDEEVDFAHQHAAHDHAAHGSHHAAHLHDAPPAMALALIVLAIGSVLAGYVGIPHALGGHNALGEWLSPAFHVAGQAVGETAEAAAEGAGEEGNLELTLMLVSSTLAILGIAIAAFIWIKRRDIADAFARSFGGVHRLLMNKYYVDELYDAAIVQPIKVISTEGLWRGIDVKVIDGAVNGTGAIVDGGAAVLRRLQNGSVRTYAGSLLVGVVVILGYYLWR